jgi:AGZA family xanthine/uracil permease-like MFS transporter
MENSLFSGLKKNFLKREIVAGITIFAAMSPILAVHPALLAVTGMNKGALLTATALSGFLATLAMAVATNYPLVLAPGGGINAYFAFTVCGLLGIPWPAALGLTFYSGALFLLITVCGLRQMIVDAIPLELKLAITCGIGLFISLIGLKMSGLVVANPATFVALGKLSQPECLMTLLGVIVTGILVSRKIRGGIAFGVLGMTLLGTLVHDSSGKLITTLPHFPFGLPPSIGPIFLHLDLFYLWHHFQEGCLVVLALLFVSIFDNMGTLIGVCNRAHLLDENGNLPKMNRAFLVDATAAMGGACLGTSTVTCYVESAAGVEEGGRTGLTAFVAGLCLVLALFLSPLILAIPTLAAAPALIVVGIFMMQGVQELDLRDFSKAAPVILTIIMMPFTFSISEGIGIGLIAYVGITLGMGRWRQLSPMTCILALIFFIHGFLGI